MFDFANLRFAAGMQSFARDGDDSHGARAARGFYFCRLNADELSATHKAVLTH